ncbi:hypothetical protein [Kozakia baliensis]|uniref:hypothetical protein n=1 Tax=Kozakia baliensis TaxID=153496 RepID=UPI000497838F|nr:hypothetical protein [Kozakia baliensis]
MRKVILISGIALLAGCAQSPNKIQAAYIPDSAYASQTCEQLGQAEIQEGDVVNSLVGKQRRAHKTDTWGVIATGIPLSEITGSDVKETLAREKGKLEAIHRVQVSKACPGAQAPIGTEPLVNK